MIKKEKSILIMIIILLFIVIIPNFVSAAGLKAEDTSGYPIGLSGDDFFASIRQMQSSTGTLGVSSSDGNKINCHMVKSTEWGTMAILAVSKYGGRPTSISTTTTGNATGVNRVYSKFTELTTGVYANNALSSIADKYKNIYSESKLNYNGDYITYSLSFTSENPWIKRGGESSLLVNATLSTGAEDPCFYHPYGVGSGWYQGTTSRAVVVNGDGI